MITFLSAFSLFAALVGAAKDCSDGAVVFFFVLSVALAILAAVL